MQTIRVNPDELLHMAGTLQSSIQDMDAAMSHALEQLTTIRDRAKGLDEIRDRARQLQQMHRQQITAAQTVQQHVAQSAQRFMETDQQLGGQVALKIAGATLASGMPIPTQLQQWLANNSDLLKQLGTVMVGGVVAPVLPAVLSGLLLQHGLSNSAAWQTIHSMIDSVTDIADLEYLAKGWGPLVSGIGSLSESLLAHGKLKWIHDSVMTFVNNEQGGVGRVLGQFEGWAGKALTGLQLMNLGMSGVNFVRSVASGDRGEIIDTGGKFAGDGLIMAASTAFPLVGAVYGISGLVQLGGGAIATGMEWLGYKEQAQTTRDVLEVIDLRAQTQKAMSWGIEKSLQIGDSVMTSAQNTIDYVSEKAQPWVEKAREIRQVSEEWMKKIPIPPLPKWPPDVCIPWPVPKLPDPPVIVF